MNISLYESDYPIQQNGTPSGEKSPVGSFRADTDIVRNKVKKNDASTFNGVYTHSRYPKPRVGEHLLAVFELDGKNYLYNSTIDYRSESDIGDNDEWPATLNFQNQISNQ